MVVSGYCVHACAEIGFPRQLIGTRDAELIRECRPPVSYLNGDCKETVTCSSLLFVYNIILGALRERLSLHFQNIVYSLNLGLK